MLCISQNTYFKPISYALLTEFRSTKIWDMLAAVSEPELRQLAHKLPQTLWHSRADSTVQKYSQAFCRWMKWAQQYQEVVVLPPQPVHVALYLQHLGESTGSKSAVEEAVNAISWVSQLTDHPPITSSSFVRATLAGLQRELAKPRVKKEPVTASMLDSLVASLGSNPSLSDVRLAASVLLSFAAFLRSDELAKLRCCDVSFSQQHMTVRIISSKTDQLRQGDFVMIARTGSTTCPVAMLERYMSMAELSTTSKLRLFRGITRSKNGERLRSSGTLSYSRMRELFRAKLQELGFDPNQYGLHSLRAGGASAAANAGVPDRLFKRHGRWRSESAKDGYIKDSESALLSVSKSLEL